MLDPPADRRQTSRRPSGASHVEAAVDAVTGDDAAKALPASERRGEGTEQGVALARLGPAEHDGDLADPGEHVGEPRIAVREHRFPQRGLADGQVSRGCKRDDQVRAEGVEQAPPKARSLLMSHPTKLLLAVVLVVAGVIRRRSACRVHGWGVVGLRVGVYSVGSRTTTGVCRDLSPASASSSSGFLENS